MDLSNLYVVEYSKDQDAWHIHSLADAVEANLTLFAKNQFNNYVIYAVTETRKEARQICQFLKEKRIATQKEANVTS